MNDVVRWTRRIGVVMLVLLAGADGKSCCNPPVDGIPRTTGDGSAQWAVQIAGPALQACAADAEVRQIFGARVGLNGRLFANVGTWSIVGWSPSTQQICQVDVAFDGKTSSSKRADAAPGPGIEVPLPAFADSTAAFAALAGHTAAGAKEATLVVFDVSDYGHDHAHQAVWGINVGSDAFFVTATGALIGL